MQEQSQSLISDRVIDILVAEQKTRQIQRVTNSEKERKWNKERLLVLSFCKKAVRNGLPFEGLKGIDRKGTNEKEAGNSNRGSKPSYTFFGYFSKERERERKKNLLIQFRASCFSNLIWKEKKEVEEEDYQERLKPTLESTDLRKSVVKNGLASF